MLLFRVIVSLQTGVCETMILTLRLDVSRCTDTKAQDSLLYTQDAAYDTWSSSDKWKICRCMNFPLCTSFEEQESQTVRHCFTTSVSWKQLFCFAAIAPTYFNYFCFFKWPLSLPSAVPLVSCLVCVVSFVARPLVQECGSFLFFSYLGSLPLCQKRTNNPVTIDRFKALSTVLWSWEKLFHWCVCDDNILRKKAFTKWLDGCGFSWPAFRDNWSDVERGWWRAGTGREETM